MELRLTVEAEPVRVSICHCLACRVELEASSVSKRDSTQNR
jgi:hypothetical protein